MLKFGHYIDNNDAPSIDYMDVRDPSATSRIVGRIADGSSEDASKAVAAAERAFPAWRDTPVQVRGALVEQISDFLLEALDELADVLVSEQGMLREISLAEIRLSASEIRTTVKVGLPLLTPKVEDGRNNHTVICAKPYGVVAGIVPWNAPIILTMTFLAPALLAGNAVIVKPSEIAPLGINLMLRRIAAVFPAGVINIVNGGARVSRALVEAEAVRKVSFTGGAPTAKQVMTACAQSLKDVQFELGGNDAAIVLEDVDLDSAVPALVQAVFRRSGQFCFAVKRIYVAEPVYRRFVEAFCAQVDEIRVGHPNTPGTTMGPVISSAKVDHIRTLVADAERHGAVVRELGQYLDVDPASGYYLRPYVVTDADDQLKIVAEEQFGPAVPILSFCDDDEAVRRANATEYGLCGSVWSTDIERATRIANRLECGRVYINAHRGSEYGHPLMPFGGVKQSGIGWSNGAYGVAAFTQYHSVDRAKTPAKEKVA